MRDYLIYTSAGKSSNIRQWYSSDKRNYDIWVTNYADIRSLNREYSDLYNEHKGSKFQNLKVVFQEHRDLLSGYKYIMVADDDIVISPNSLCALFDLSVNRDLWLLQPAFSRFGIISHGITKRRLFSGLRYTSFVEVGCPIFKTEKLFDFLSVYDPELSTSFGIDWWFLHHFGADRQDRYAISDEYYCINPRKFLKPGGRREIDLISSNRQRILMGERIGNKFEIDRGVFKEYQKIRRPLPKILASLPGFILLEVLLGMPLAFVSFIKRIIRNRDFPDGQSDRRGE